MALILGTSRNMGMLAWTVVMMSGYALREPYHLDAHGLDLAGEQEHGRAGADGGDVARLQVVDHLRQSVQPVLHREVKLVVHRAKEVSYLSHSGELKVKR